WMIELPSGPYHAIPGDLLASTAGDGPTAGSRATDPPSTRLRAMVGDLGDTLYHAVQPCGREMDSRSSPFFYWAILNATSGGDLAREVFDGDSTKLDEAPTESNKQGQGRTACKRAPREQEGSRKNKGRYIVLTMLVHPSAVNSLVLVGSLGLGSAAAPKGSIRERRLLTQKKDLLSPSGGAPPFNEKNRRGDGRPGRRKERRAKIAELKSESSTEEIPAVDTGVIGHEAVAAPVASKLDVGFVDCVDGFVSDDEGVTCEDACGGNCCDGNRACDFFTGRVAKDGSCDGIPATMRGRNLSPTRRASERKLAVTSTHTMGKSPMSPMGPVRDIRRAFMPGTRVSTLDLPSPRHAWDMSRAMKLVMKAAAWGTLWVRATVTPPAKAWEKGTCQYVATGGYQSVSAIVNCCNDPDGNCAGAASNDGLIAADPTCKDGVFLAELAKALEHIEEESESDTSPFTEKQLCHGKTAVEIAAASLSKGHSTAAVRYGVNKAIDDLGCNDKTDSEICEILQQLQ
ncbi:hypothetical protein THAOC_16040, partial [Thalassiosira oceanica]